MTKILDPRDGDIEDDASSTKQRSLLSLAGSLFAEISLPKLAIAWIMLIAVPGLLLGTAPLLISLWTVSIWSKATNLFNEALPALLLAPLAALGWFAGRPILRLAESGFWSLNALAVQPAYIVFREGLRHLVERLLGPGASDERRAAVRAGVAAASGLLVCALGIALVVLLWPASRWVGSLTDLRSPRELIPVALANGAVLVCAYFALAALVWGIADATMAQPRDLRSFCAPTAGARTWRVVHLSDLHTVGERFGFRLECGRSGPQGNERLRRTLACLNQIHATQPLDMILITGDLTDAGRCAEWAEFFSALDSYPTLAQLVVALPGNHDVNVVDRASPARMDLPTSPMKRLRRLRAIAALATLQGARLRTVETKAGRLGDSLAERLEPHARDIAAFADKGSGRLSRSLAGLWEAVFPMVLPPDTEHGLGVIVLNSNADTHFSFTNALGLVSAEQARAIDLVTDLYPRACWIVALHHHVVEYPRAAKTLSERIGTALINGSWFVRRLGRLADHAVIMHGHRHVDWIGECAGLLIISAPSPVMEAVDRPETYFYVHTLIAAGGRLSLMKPERISVRDGEPAGVSAPSATPSPV